MKEINEETEFISTDYKIRLTADMIKKPTCLKCGEIWTRWDDVSKTWICPHCKHDFTEEVAKLVKKCLQEKEDKIFFGHTLSGFIFKDSVDYLGDFNKSEITTEHADGFFERRKERIREWQKETKKEN